MPQQEKTLGVMTKVITLETVLLKLKIILLKMKIKIKMQIMLLELKKPLLLEALLKLPLLEWVIMQKILKKSKTKMVSQSKKRRSANIQQVLKKFSGKKLKKKKI